MNTLETPVSHATRHSPHSRSGASVGRDVRLGAGILMLVGNMVLIFLDAMQHEPITTQDIMLHAMVFVAGLFLVDSIRCLELLGMVKDKLPLVGKG